MLLLSEKEIRNLYSMKECIGDIEQAFRYYTEGKTVTPVRSALTEKKLDAVTLYMPSYVEDSKHMGIKIVSVFPHNREKGKPTVQGVTLLTDAATGEHVAMLNATYLTVLRTGASSGVATKYLARTDSKICAVLGCGAQAFGQVQAVMEVRELKQLLLYNRNRTKAEDLKKRILELYPDWRGDIVICDQPDKAVQVSDIVICSTRATSPIFDGDSLSPGTHINAIGSYLPHMQEIDLTTLRRSSKIVVDTLEGVLHEAGDFLIPMEKGEWSHDEIYAELGEIVTGRKNGRQADKEITLFKSVGVAFLDLVVAKAVYDKAREFGVGTVVEL